MKTMGLHTIRHSLVDEKKKIYYWNHTNLIVDLAIKI